MAGKTTVSKLRLKTGDTVKVTSGVFKGKTAKIVKVHQAERKVALEGINVRKRHIKPNQLNPRGGTKDVHLPIDASNVALVIDKQNTVSRIGYTTKEDGTKVRVARQANNKEIQ